jgi:hypothetical protein
VVPVQDRSYGRFELGFLALRGRRAGPDKSKGDQLNNVPPAAVGALRRTDSYRREVAVGPGTRRGRGNGRLRLRCRRVSLRARWGSGTCRLTRRGGGRRGRMWRGGPGRNRRESRGRRCLRTVGLGTGRACRRGAGLAGPQTVPQEFVALVHGLLGYRAINLRACGRPRALLIDERHGPTDNAGH